MSNEASRREYHRQYYQAHRDSEKRSEVSKTIFDLWRK